MAKFFDWLCNCHDKVSPPENVDATVRINEFSDSALLDMKLAEANTILVYNIPRACLLNRSPAPAMDLKAIETCRRLRKLCRKRSNNVARHDKTPVK